MLAAFIFAAAVVIGAYARTQFGLNIDRMRRDQAGERMRLDIAADVARIDAALDRQAERLMQAVTELSGRIDVEATRRLGDVRAVVEHLGVLRGRLDTLAANAREDRAAALALLKAGHTALNDQAVAASRARAELAAQLGAFINRDHAGPNSERSSRDDSRGFPDR